MRKMKIVAIAGLVMALAGLGMVTANAQQQGCAPAGPIIADTFTTVTFRSAAGKEIVLPAPPSDGILVQSETPWLIQEAHWLKKDAPFGNPIEELVGRSVNSSIEIGFLDRFGAVSLDGQTVKLFPPQDAGGLEIRALQEWVIQATSWTKEGYICDEIRGLKGQPVQSIQVITPRL